MTVSTHKTTIEEGVVLTLLENIYPSQISNLEFIAGGEGSQAFSFQNEGEGYVVRINRHSNEGFKKDEQAYIRFSSEMIPIPEILQIGQMDNGYYYAISKKVDGVLAKDIPTEEVEQFVPQMFEVLDAIHAVVVADTAGYGKWNSTNNAKNTTWREFLLEVDMYAVGTEIQPSLFTTSFLEKEIWDQIYAQLFELLQYCPEERYLLHGDYGFDNLFGKDGKVAGVIDWEHSMYGDFLYDIAWLSFWSTKFDYSNSYQKHFQSRGKEIQHFDERLLCYKLYIGLGSLSFYAYSNQKDKYESSKEKLLKLISSHAL